MILSLFQPLLSAITHDSAHFTNSFFSCEISHLPKLCLRGSLQALSKTSSASFEDIAVMTCLTAVLTLKVVVPANTGFREQKVARDAY